MDERRVGDLDRRRPVGRVARPRSRPARARAAPRSSRAAWGTPRRVRTDASVAQPLAVRARARDDELRPWSRGRRRCPRARRAPASRARPRATRRRTRARRRRPRGPDERRQALRDAGPDHARVASGGAGADAGRLQHGHAAAGPAPERVVRGRQPREAAAHDHQVARARGQLVAERLAGASRRPQPARPVVSVGKRGAAAIERDADRGRTARRARCGRRPGSGGGRRPSRARAARCRASVGPATNAPSDAGAVPAGAERDAGGQVRHARRPAAAVPCRPRGARRCGGTAGCGRS